MPHKLQLLIMRQSAMQNQPINKVRRSPLKYQLSKTTRLLLLIDFSKHFIDLQRKLEIWKVKKSTKRTGNTGGDISST